jgi:coenzyme F420 hydrogenase subunit beta
MTEEGPKLVSLCKACGACYYGCPRSQSFSAEALETSLDSDKRDDVLGRYIKIVSARTKLDKVVARAQDGGVVTTLLMYAMEKKLIDGAVGGV